MGFSSEEATAAAKAAVAILDAALGSAAMAGQGPSSWALLDRDTLRSVCSGLSPSAWQDYGLPGAGGAVVASLAYGEGPPEPPDWALPYGGPLLALARFARADWYGELRARLRAVSSTARQSLRDAGLDPGHSRDWRILANSGLPEKPLALAAGLGSPGRNSLVILGAEGKATGHPSLGDAIGPGAILGVLLLPSAIRIEPEVLPAAFHSEVFPPGGPCVSCAACVRACPTGAIPGDEVAGLHGRAAAPSCTEQGTMGFRRELCLQHWSALDAVLPPAIEAAWGNRLYGCDLCLEACPWWKSGIEKGARGGHLGPGLPAGFFLAAPDAEIRERLHGTVLGRAWMEIAAFRRNARLAYGAFDGKSTKL